MRWTSARTLCHSCRRHPAGAAIGTVESMGIGLLWVILGTAVVVLVIITLYVDSLRR
ncbi:hypothetical protein GCM10027610_046530 [Dactylosporangium cerinum]